jgi:hypothetical protein
MTCRNRVLTFSFVALILFLAGETAFSANAVTQASPNPNACGTTVEENLAAARKALQSDDKTTRAALACLIDAVSTLNAQRLDEVRGDGGRVIHVPQASKPLP